MDSKMYALLNKFANSHILATHINVEISEHRQSYEAKDQDTGAHYEDAKLLASIVMGAENLMHYLSRNGYKIVKKKDK